MNTKSAPGPWVIADDHNTSPIRIWDSNKTLIAQTIADQREGINPQANARIIAAAPEMFNLLQWTLGQLEGEYPESVSAKNLYGDKLRGLIAKITGAL